MRWSVCVGRVCAACGDQGVEARARGRVRPTHPRSHVAPGDAGHSRARTRRRWGAGGRRSRARPQVGLFMRVWTRGERGRGGRTRLVCDGKAGARIAEAEAYAAAAGTMPERKLKADAAGAVVACNEECAGRPRCAWCASSRPARVLGRASCEWVARETRPRHRFAGARVRRGLRGRRDLRAVPSDAMTLPRCTPLRAQPRSKRNHAGVARSEGAAGRLRRPGSPGG